MQADGQTVLYPHSWSLAALQETVTAGPGQVEQSLIVAERPPGQGERLELRARLQILTGERLYANGAEQEAAFSTTGAINIRNAAGETVLTLAPPSPLSRIIRSGGCRAVTTSGRRARANGRWP